MPFHTNEPIPGQVRCPAVYVCVSIANQLTLSHTMRGCRDHTSCGPSGRWTARGVDREACSIGRRRPTALSVFLQHTSQSKALRCSLLHGDPIGSGCH